MENMHVDVRVQRINSSFFFFFLLFSETFETFTMQSNFKLVY